MADRFHQGGGSKGDWAVGGALSTTGDITAGNQGTGGTNIYGRHHWVNTAGAVHFYDLDGSVYEVAKLGVDSSPALNVVFQVGNAANGLAPAWTINTATLAIAFASDVSWAGQNLSGAHAGGVKITGQSTTSGLVTPLIIQAQNSAGTNVSAISFSNAGVITIVNNSGLTVPFVITAGSARAVAFGQLSENNKGTVTSAVTIDWAADGASQRLTLTSATALTVTFTAPSVIGWFTLKVIYPASGTVPAITWPATVRWEQGAQPTGTKTLGRATIYRFYFDGTNYWGDAILNAA